MSTQLFSIMIFVVIMASSMILLGMISIARWKQPRVKGVLFIIIAIAFIFLSINVIKLAVNYKASEMVRRADEPKEIVRVQDDKPFEDFGTDI